MFQAYEDHSLLVEEDQPQVRKKLALLQKDTRREPHLAEEDRKDPLGLREALLVVLKSSPAPVRLLPVLSLFRFCSWRSRKEKTSRLRVAGCPVLELAVAREHSRHRLGTS